MGLGLDEGLSEERVRWGAGAEGGMGDGGGRVLHIVSLRGRQSGRKEIEMNELA